MSGVGDRGDQREPGERQQQGDGAARGKDKAATGEEPATQGGSRGATNLGTGQASRGSSSGTRMSASTCGQLPVSPRSSACRTSSSDSDSCVTNRASTLPRLGSLSRTLVIFRAARPASSSTAW